MISDVFSLSERLRIPQTTIRERLSKTDFPFAKCDGLGRSKISFDDANAFALTALRDLVTFGVAPRDGSEFAERILTRASARPDDLIAIVKGGASPVLEIVDADAMPRIDAGTRLVPQLRAVWTEVVGEKTA